MVVTIIYTVLNWLSPMDGDDFVYRFIFRNGYTIKSTEVNSFHDLVSSQIDHFLHENSRTPVHIIAQALLMVNGKWLFNIFNPFFFLAFILLTVRYATGRINFHTTVLVVFLIVVFPCFDHFYLWMMGCMNYLWTSVVVLVFLILLEKRKDKLVSKSSWGILLFSFFAGWTHEGITIPIAVGFILAALPKWRKLKKTEYTWMLLCFLLGAALCLSFTIYKAFTDSSGSLIETLQKKIETGNSIMADLRLIYALIVGCLIGLLCCRKRFFSFFRENIRWFWVTLLGIGIVYATGLARTRTAYIVEFGSLLLLVRLYIVFKPNKAVKRMLSTIMILLMLALFSIVCYWSVQNYKHSLNYIQQMKEGNTTVIADYFYMPRFIEPYIEGFSCLGSNNVSYLNPDLTGTKIIALYYHLPTVAFYPMKLLEDMAYAPDSFTEFSDCGYLPYYVKRKTDKDLVDQVIYKLRPAKETEKPWWVRLTGIQREIDQEVYLLGDFANVIVGEDEWICVQKNSKYDDRIESIVIKTKANEKDFKNKKIISHEKKDK